ncbi:MAG: response regulator, partial [Clostridiales bacterium]|nr:response regulator [Clostridiales bacterium]
EIPIYARILTIADVYDALTSRRSYKNAYSHKEAVGMILEGRGSLFDPGLVDIFMKANNRFEQALAAKQENV